MSVATFNASLLIGWIMVLIGGVLLNVGAGLMFGGLLLLVMVFVVARIAGVFSGQKEGIE